MHGDGENWRFSTEITLYLGNGARYRTIWNGNRKSWVPDRIVSFSMTWSDSKPGLQGHCILPSEISKNRCVLGTKLLKNTNRKPYTIYRMITLSMILSDLLPRFQGHDVFDIEYFRNETRKSQGVDSGGIMGSGPPENM